MILREVIEQLQVLEDKYTDMGQAEVRDSDDPEYTVASVEYDYETDRIYIQFEEA